MKRIIFTLLLVLPMMVACCNQPAKKAEAVPEQPKVYMTTDISAEGLVKVFEALGVKPEGPVAVKISTGEPGGKNYLKPELIGQLVQSVDGTIVECNTAYRGPRYTTEEHMKVAEDHGFTAIAPVDIMDGEGDFELEVQDTTHIKYNLVGTHLKNYNFMINLAHFKGHVMGGFGGVLKNQSIGVASSRGKAYIHSVGNTDDIDKMWEFMGDQDGFLESMAAAAQSIHTFFGNGERIVYINVMNNMSVDCDCSAHPADPVLKDMGILASTDPVALDQACLDLVFGHTSSEGDDSEPLKQRIKERHATHIVDYAEQIGLGSKTYELVNID
ncbi:MAG: DUF362 domain-containing protein [Rikenellaceae bacterium]|nr:DUF362 domain-containing protein [Rikenellaceae bacterium]